VLKRREHRVDELALEHAVAALELVELAVTQTLNDGGSVRQVASATGLSPTTVQKYGNKHGWPSVERRTQLTAVAHERAAFLARIGAAGALADEIRRHMTDA
jgi:DNA-binding NarL/FixJ family response regulator